jgi:hypothetical protein
VKLDEPKQSLLYRIHGYEVTEVAIPDPVNPKRKRQAWKMIIRGDYFHVGGLEVTARVGDVPAFPGEVSPDGTQMEAYLLNIPEEGAPVIVTQGPHVMEAAERFSRRRIRPAKVKPAKKQKGR